MDIVQRVLVVSAAALSFTMVAGPVFAISDCFYSGVNFSDGSVSCQSGHQFRCSDGDWQALDLNCEMPPSPAKPAVTNPTLCTCTDVEAADCDRAGQNCCVALQDGNCTKRCCPR
jgi:hypothetical protein